VPPTTSGLVSKISWMRAHDARPRCTTETAKPKAIIGQVIRPSASQKAKKSPFVRPPCSGPWRRSAPPYHMKIRMPAALTAPIIGPIEPRSRARPRLASR
jgi:hypothetical protein